MLAPLGVGNFLADPTLTVYSANEVAAANDNWNGAGLIESATAQVGAFAFTSGASKDAALVRDFGLGNHTIQIAGTEAGTGVAIAEVYDLTPAGTYNPAASARIINVSARGQIDPGGILFAGFSIGGSTSRTVLIRAVGPTLGFFGVSDALGDPRLDLYTGAGALLLANDDWGGDRRAAAAIAAAGAFPLDPTTKDAVILTTLPLGSYTVQVKGVGDSRGVVLLEIYDLP